MGILNRLKRFLPIQTKVLIYNSLVLSHLNFAILQWGFKCEKILDKINTHTLQCFSGYIQNKLYAMLPGKLPCNGLLCMQELHLGSHKFYLTYDWNIFSFV